MITMLKTALRLFLLGCLSLSLLATTAPAPAAPAVLAETNNAIAVRAGVGQTCALMANGDVICWGTNKYGQLGGVQAGQTGPKLMSGLTGIVKDLSNTYQHTCVLTTSGGVKCWGYNGGGQLGIGREDYYDHGAPTDVTGLTSGVTAISVGGLHTCVLTSTGGVKCWGYNAQGQLGDGTSSTRTRPVDVVGLSSGVAAVSAGGSHTCALMTNGGVKCWGGMLFWQADQAVPNDVAGLTSGVRKVVSGSWHNCALTNTGGVKCWGQDDEGQLGDGTTNGSQPRDVLGLTSGVKDLVAGTGNACAILNSGTIKCWGMNTYGQLGDGTQTRRLSPVTMTAFASPVRQLSMGAQHTCALTLGGAVYCWGSNKEGQLGDGTLIQQKVPTSVTGLPGSMARVTTGFDHTCALTTGGAVMCWGTNTFGQLGDGTRNNRYYPVYVSGLNSGIQNLSGSKIHYCASALDGSLRCWGYNAYGQLGDGSTAAWNVPVQVSGLADALVDFSVGGYHTCALVGAAGTDDYGVQCWGMNSSGQLGDGTTTQRSVPGYVTGLTAGVRSIAAGQEHTCVLTTGGAVKCWGYNSYGQLGDGTQTPHSAPIDVTGLSSGVVAIAAGEYNTCALTDAGGLKCWGRNDEGQIGDRTFTSRRTPTNVYGLTSNVASVSIGGLHICAVITGGAAKCWGKNTNGQLGDGTTIQRSSSVSVTGLTSGVADISAGDNHTCALLDSGDIKCWGDDRSGQLSVGRLEYSLTPIRVLGIDDSSLFTITGIVSGFQGPMAGVTVTLANRVGDLEQKITGTDGSFTFSNYAAGAYTLTPNALYRSFSPSSQGVTLSDADISGLDFVAHYQPAALSGTVSRQGQVLAGVSVRLSNDSGTAAYAITGSDGSYNFPAVDEGMVTLEPVSPIYTFTPITRQVTVAGQVMDELDFSADYRPAPVSGTVSLPGGSPSSITVSLYQAGQMVQEQTIGQDGAFMFPDLPSGAYTVIPKHSRYLFTPASLDVNLAGEAINGLHFSATYQPAALSGAVFSGTVPLAGVTVSLRDESGEPAQQVTGEDGLFSFPDLPGGTYWLVPSHAQYVFAPPQEQVSLIGVDIDGLTFQAAYRTAALSGLVMDDAGSLAGVTVVLYQADTKIGQQVTGADGRFAFPDLPAGEYRLIVQKTDYTFSPAWQVITLAGQDAQGIVFNGKYEGKIYLPLILL